MRTKLTLYWSIIVKQLNDVRRALLTVGVKPKELKGGARYLALAILKNEPLDIIRDLVKALIKKKPELKEQIEKLFFELGAKECQDEK